MPRRAAFALVLLLAACGREEAATPLAQAPAAPPAEAPMPEAPPPSLEPSRYVGRWAASADLCQSGAWTFGEKTLSTAGEVSCTFDQVTPTADGYDIEAACLSEGARASGRLSLAFAASAGAMLLTGGPYEWDVGLIPCAP